MTEEKTQKDTHQVSLSAIITEVLVVVRVVKDTFLKYLNTKYKILLRNVFEILLSNTSTLKPKIQNTKYLFAIVFEIQNTQVRSYNTQLVNVRIGFEQQKCFEHVRQFVAFRAADNAAKAK